jgi:hypothetical protein
VRLALAAIVTLSLLAAAVSPHAHAGDRHSEQRCAACAVRGADAASHQVPDLAPLDVPAGDASPEPGPSPVTGAPQGAIPGPSPPRAA